MRRSGSGLDEIEWLTLNAMKSAFLPFDERLVLITDVIKPGYAALRAELADQRTSAREPGRQGPRAARLDDRAAVDQPGIGGTTRRSLGKMSPSGRSSGM